MRQVLQIVTVIIEWHITGVAIVIMVYNIKDLHFYLSYYGLLKQDFTFFTLTSTHMVTIEWIFVDTFLMEFFYYFCYYYYHLLGQSTIVHDM